MNLKKVLFFSIFCITITLVFFLAIIIVPKINNKRSNINENFLSFNVSSPFLYQNLEGWEFMFIVTKVNHFEVSDKVKYVNVNYYDKDGVHELKVYLGGDFPKGNDFFNGMIPVFQSKDIITEKLSGMKVIQQKYQLTTSSLALDTKKDSFLLFIVLTKYNEDEIESEEFCLSHKYECDYISVVEKYGFKFNNSGLVNIKDDSKYIIPFGLYEAY